MGNGRFVWQRFCKGERPLVHRPGLERLAQTLSVKRVGSGRDFDGCGAGWLAEVWGIASGSVGKGRFGVPESWKGNGRFMLNFLPTASAIFSIVSPLRRSVLTNFAQASRPRRWSGVPPNIGSRRRWRDASDGLLFGDWQRLWTTAPARLNLALVGPLPSHFLRFLAG